MNITPEQGREWRQWLLVTSIPLVHLSPDNQVLGLGSGTMVDHAGGRYVLAAEHVVKRDSSGWAVVVQQHGEGQLEYYRPNAFVYLGEFQRSTAAMRFIDICAARLPSDFKSWYEYRTPSGLFDKRPHHVFGAGSIERPISDQIYGFCGQVRTEQHGPGVFASDMVVYPGLTYAQSEEEMHHFNLPVPHPGHDAFQGCSGSPICDIHGNLVAIVVGGSRELNTVRGVAVQRVIPALEFLSSSAVPPPVVLERR